MTKDIKSEIRDQYINEYMDAAGAKKTGFLGKLWRGAMKIDTAMKKWNDESQLKYNAFMVTGSVLPTVLLLGAFAVNPLLGLAVLAGAATTIVTFLRADVLVRREAWDTITKDIDDGKLSDRFKTDVLDLRSRELEQKVASLPVKGAAIAQFAASAEAGASEPEPMVVARGIERPHGRNFG
ncbi:MAG: hypothetical protein PSY14_06490 [bacterium]|nr:hypothetical protein [bacterium]